MKPRLLNLKLLAEASAISLAAVMSVVGFSTYFETTDTARNLRRLQSQKHLTPQYPFANLETDQDQDGLSDREEDYIFGTDPETMDTDGDGYTDFAEVLNCYQPFSDTVHNREKATNALISSWRARAELYGTGPYTTKHSGGLFLYQDSCLPDAREIYPFR